jgi:hypothetical protein
MLNPDGAERFHDATRKASTINRDALALQTPRGARSRR